VAYQDEYLQLYDLENYLFTVVRDRFHVNKKLSAFDFFCIVIWKANRAKSLVARNLKEKCGLDLDGAVGGLTSALASADSSQARLDLLLIEWKFRLPIASAILSVLYPEDFTVYDVRVCDELGEFHRLVNTTNPTKRWEQYLAFRAAVEMRAPSALTLRDKDRWLWGKSFSEQLMNDVHHGFANRSG
jgi:hypothetical protein